MSGVLVGFRSALVSLTWKCSKHSSASQRIRGSEQCCHQGARPEREILLWADTCLCWAETRFRLYSHFSTPKDHRKHGSVSPLLPPDQQCPQAEVIPADLSELQSSLRSRLGDSSLPNYWHFNAFKKYINFSFSVVINGKVGLNYLVCHYYNLKS